MTALDSTLPTFDHRLIRELPGDPLGSPGTREVFGALWSRVAPTPVGAPRLLAVSPEVMRTVGLDPELAEHDPDRLARIFSGNELLPGMDPYAANYGGHQFGVWAGQLGDGRAITLGEGVNAQGERWELQLKGAGPTPYSRRADGRAVLRSSIREFLCSEAMHHLGVPTTRALTLVETGEAVVRDILYMGDPRPEPGAVVCRVAPSFLRFGSYQLPSARGEIALLEQLVDFTLDRDFPHLLEVGPSGAEGALERRALWFREVAERTADLMVHWMRVGFVHGVMNTDNLSILGLTLDYGPYGWLEDFDPGWTPNTTDLRDRRYRYEAQPSVAQWNLARLAEALLPLFPNSDPLEAGLDAYVARYNAGYLRMTAEKFGLLPPGGDPENEEVRQLIREGYGLLVRGSMDYTLFFQALAEVLDPEAAESGSGPLAPFEEVFYGAEGRDAVASTLELWLGRWKGVVGRLWRGEGEMGPLAAQEAMNRVNPRLVLRNWMAQEVIDQAEAGDPSGVITLLDWLRTPYQRNPSAEHRVTRRPAWAENRAGCSMLSCSS